MKHRVTKRVLPCVCGCGGKDPWHQKTYRRTLEDVEEVSGIAETALGTHPFDARARCSMPWSEAKVEVVRVLYAFPNGKSTSMGWYLREDT